MQTTTGPVLIIGGTSGTGLRIAQLLDARGTVVRVLARDPVTARAILEPTIAIARGDITVPPTLPGAIAGAEHIVFTAGIRSGRPARETDVRATEYDGVLNTLAAAREAGFSGRFLYMTSIGVDVPSLAARGLNAFKRNTLVWRARAEPAIRESGVDYTIIRSGFLLRGPGGRRALAVAQRPLPLSLRYRIARADVAEAFVVALDDARTIRSTFSVFYGTGQRRESWADLFDSLQPDT